jgi:hypothetical protein
MAFYSPAGRSTRHPRWARAGYDGHAAGDYHPWNFAGAPQASGGSGMANMLAANGSSRRE